MPRDLEKHTCGLRVKVFPEELACRSQKTEWGRPYLMWAGIAQLVGGLVRLNGKLAVPHQPSCEYTDLRAQTLEVYIF